MADIKEAIRRLIYEYVVEGADKVMQTQEAVAASTTKTDKASLSLEKSFGNLERRYVDTVRHQQDYAKVQEKVNAAVAQNPELQDRANVVLAAASEHFNNLAANASKGTVASTLLSKAIGFVIGPAGLLGVAMTAVGIAAEAMWRELSAGRTTVEQALAEQNRLMNETKTSVDQLITAQTRLRSGDQTMFESKQNLIDLEKKYQQAIQYTIDRSERRTTSPLQDIGVGLGIIEPVKDPGYEKIAVQVERLKAAFASGQVDLVTFNNEISKIGEADQGVAAFVQAIIRAGKEAFNLEQGLLKARAALQSMEQVKLANLQMKEGAEAAQRIAEETTKLRDIYPGVSTEVAKQLQALDDQLRIAKARNDEEKKVANEIALQHKLRLEGKETEEEQLVVSKQRLITEKQIADALAKQEEQAEQARKSKDLAMIAAAEAATARENEAKATHDLANSTLGLTHEAQRYGNVLQQNNSHMSSHVDSYDAAIDKVDELIGRWERLDTLQSQFSESDSYESSYDPLNISTQKRNLEKVYGAENVEAVTRGVGLNQYTTYQLKQSYLDEPTNRLKNSVDKLKDSTDSLNATMQDALSPYYSQDPRTTKLGFRAGTVGNPDWMTGATNANPLDAILGKGATAPGMADGGSFVVGGGYSANDNKIAMFPVASGEEVIVNRDRQQGRGAQVINIDNRIIVAGSVDSDALTKMKVSRYQQSQRMRAGLARA